MLQNAALLYSVFRNKWANFVFIILKKYIKLTKAKEIWHSTENDVNSVNSVFSWQKVHTVNNYCYTIARWPQTWKTWSRLIDFYEHAKLMDSQGILCNLGKFLTSKIVSIWSNIYARQQGLGLQINKVSWILRWSQCSGDLLCCRSWCGMALDIWRSLLHQLFVAIT